MKQAGYLLALALALLAAMALKGALLVLPAPPETPSATVFDANRAVARLQRILGDQRPHPVDSAEGDAVRERLVAEMRSVGLAPRVTDNFVCNGRRGAAVSCARVRNLVATIGPAEGSHLLLVSHYDSTPVGPGASDDGIGVAAMLEVAHLLRGQRLNRPITFLFNEGEEAGLLGARAFLDQDALSSRVDMVVNLESRGVNGPAIMFETSRPNGAAVALYRTVSRPVANSLSTDLYRLIPNSTDVAVFEERPLTILNFAVIGNETRYHSAGDDLAALDRSSLQHMGAQVEQVTRRVAQGQAPAADGDRLYADIGGWVLIVLPMLFGLILLGLLFLFFATEAWRRRAAGRPLLAMLAALVLSGALAFGGHFILSLIRAGDYWRAYPLVATTAVYASALAACAMALLLVAGTGERTKLRAAFWLFFTLLGGAICFVAPGAAIYFLLPPLVMALGMVGKRWHPRAETVGAVLAAILLYLTFGPAVALFEELMNGGPIWMFAPLGMLMMLPILIELQPALTRLRALLTVAGALDLAMIGWIVAGFTPAYSADRQQRFSIEYAWDANRGTAEYAVNNDGAPVPFQAEWTRARVPYASSRRWLARAPAPGAATRTLLQPPQLIPVGSRRDANRVHLKVRIAMHGAEQFILALPSDTAVWGAGVPGAPRDFGGPPGNRFIRCAGRSCDGAELEIVLPSPRAFAGTIVGIRPGLPPEAAGLARARPALARAQYNPDSIVAYRAVSFDAAAAARPPS